MDVVIIRDTINYSAKFVLNKVIAARKTGLNVYIYYMLHTVYDLSILTNDINIEGGPHIYSNKS